MNSKTIFSIVTVTLLLMAAVPLISGGSEGAEGKFEMGQMAPDYEKTDEKTICNATLDDDFADNGVLVVLNKETSLSFKTYAPDDFNKTRYSKVTELTKEFSAFAKKQYDSKTSLSQNVSITDTASSDELNGGVDNYRAILYLELAEGGKENVLAAIKQLEERDDVLSAEPNYTVYTCATPNDPFLVNQWAINNANLPNAWNVTTGSSTITVGVIDTGIDGNHPDLTNRINKSLCRDFSSGQTVVVSNPTDPIGHGTHVAGIIGAQGNNGIGIAGTCWDVRMVSLKIFTSSLYSQASYIISAIDYGCSKGIRLFNLSISMNDYSAALEQTMKSQDALFVCAAGNNNRDTDLKKNYPSSFNLSNIISVGATNQSNSKAVPSDWGSLTEGSNWGATTVDIFAPGTSILSTIPNNNYVSWNGTSMAAPYVTGVAALLLTKNTCSPYGLKTLIMNNVDKVSALSNLCVTGGKLNAQKAVNANLFGGGKGTSSDPYQISTSQHLKDIENFSADNAYYKMTANITLSGNWMTSYDTTQPNKLFGTFDGNGKTISGLSITSSAVGNGYFGLFHETRGTVKNLTMNSVNINRNNGFLIYVGAISGQNNYGTIDNCTVNGSITISGTAVFVGGVTGFSNSGTIKNSTNNATITSSNTLGGYENGATGGIVGYYEYTGIGGTISYCNNNGAVTGNDCTGGIVGNFAGVKISYCNNNGAVTGNDCTGGIVGVSYFSTISNCNTNVSSKNVNLSWKTLNANNAVGGIAGEAHYGTLEYCTFKGIVKYTSPSSTSTSLQPKMGQIAGQTYSTTLKSNTGSGSVDKGTLQMVGSYNQALYAAQNGLYGKQV